MIKAIFFDFAGVISTKPNIVSDYFIPYYNLPAEELKERYYKGRIGKATFKEITKGIQPQKIYLHLNSSELSPNAKKVLSRLSKKYELYIASNHLPNFFEKEVKHLGVKKYFKAFFPSYKIKYHKPQKEYYLAILRKTKLNPRECVFVDDAKINLKPAKELGFTTIWFNKKNNDPRNKINYKPDYEINNLEQVTKKLEQAKRRKT